MPTLLRSSLSLPKLHASASLNDVELFDNLRHTTPVMNPRLQSKLHSADDIRSTANVDDLVPSFRAGPGDIPIMEESVTYDTNLKQKGVIYSGVLYRRRRGPMAQWIERWTLSHFVLTWNCLRYYSQNGEKLRGEVDLTNATIQVLPIDSVFNGRQATLWRFAVCTHTRRLLMSAMTEYEMNVWVKHLLVAMGLDDLKQASILNRMQRAESDDVPLVDFANEDTLTATMQEMDECEEHSISSTESAVACRAWRARLFEVDENALVRTLTYYDVHNTAQGHVVLTGMDPRIRVQDADKQAHSFVLKTKQTCVWLAATSDAMMWKWIDFLVLHHCASLDEHDRQSMIARESMFSMSETSESLVEHRESTIDRTQVRRIASQNDLHQLGVEIEHQMLENIGMTKLALPTDTALSQCHVFVSDHWQNVSKILLLIGNSNSNIPPGIWSRHGCNSLGIERGSMLPYISYAIDNGYGVMVLDMGTHFNTFFNGSTRVKVPVKGSSTPEEHIHFAWTQLLPSTRAHDVVAIAYGLGGVSLNDFLLSYPRAIAEDAPYTMKSIAFLQSFHKGAEGSIGRFLRTRSMKWDCHPSIPFNQPMATPVPFMYQNEASMDSWCLSVGPDEDNLFSNVMESVFNFLDFCIDVDDQLNICTDRWIALNCTTT